MGYSVGILIYNGFSLRDLAGPYQIFSESFALNEPDQPLFDQFTISRNKELVTCHGGLQIIPTHIYPDAHIYDVLLVPGGPGIEEAIRNLRLMNWLKRAARLAKVISAVGNGTFILASSGIVGRQPVADIPGLGDAYPALHLVPGVGIVVGQNVITASDSSFGSKLGHAVLDMLSWT